MRCPRSLLPVVAVAAAVALNACSEDEAPQGGPTLPPIATSSTTSSSVPTATTLPQYYEVRRGDTLTLIAAAYSIPVQALMKANQLTNPDDIAAGQFLIIPRREDIVAEVLPPTVPGQTAPPMPTVAGATTTVAPTTT
jgi:LysM repeat protein